MTAQAYNISMPLAKVDLRRQLKQLRLQMTAADRTLKSRDIVMRLQQAIDWSAVKTLHYFEPIHELLEVDIRDFITDLEDKYPDLQLAIPRLIGNTWELVAARGASTNSFDVIIVPMLGFDPKTLHRIGYGGGYYDRFLATQPQARKIGVCYDSGQTANIPINSYDIAMDIIITETDDYAA